jgi:hypothetical protein
LPKGRAAELRDAFVLFPDEIGKMPMGLQAKLPRERIEALDARYGLESFGSGLEEEDDDGFAPWPAGLRPVKA